MAKLRVVALAVLTLFFALLIASNYATTVKAETATTLTLSITPSTAEHSSASQPLATSTLQLSLTSEGTGLAGKTISLSYRTAGATSWISLFSVTTDSSGQYKNPSFSIEYFVGRATGDFEFKADYIPSGADNGVYAASTSNIVSATITPHVLEATSVTISITPSTFEHSSASQPIVTGNLIVTLSSGGHPLANRYIALSYRPVGVSSWTALFSAPTDSSGQVSIASFPPEYYISNPGTYEFKATYTPSAGVDDTDYIGSEATCTLTLTPHTLESTTTTISISPSTFEHSSASQPIAVGNLLITLSSGGHPLASRYVTINCRPVGVSSWSTLFSAPTDSSGQVSIASFPIEYYVSNSGTYEFQAVYTPSVGVDDTDYIGSEASCTVTLTPHTLQSTVTTVSITPSTFEHSSASQPMATQNFKVTLFAGEKPLAGRYIHISWRSIGSSSWNSLPDMIMTDSGEFSTDFPVEFYIDDPGTYEFKAVYTPSAGVDDTDYVGSEASCTVTLTPHPIEATTATISITPNTFPQHSTTVPLVMEDFVVTLSADGKPLTGRYLSISWRQVGSSTWHNMPDLILDASGQFSTSLSIEYYVTNPGTYEFRAVYTPSVGVDDTDYTGSQATCTVTLTAISSDQSLITVNNHQGSGSHLSTSGVTIATTDTSLPNGFQLQFASIDYGTTAPSTTSSFSVSGNLYYDVQVLPVSGTLGPDVMVTVQITDISFVPTSTVSYWTGSAWQLIPCTFTAPSTISFTIEASKLTGTEVVVHQASLVSTPEYPLGAILAVGACFFAVAVFRLAKKPTLHLSYPLSS